MNRLREIRELKGLKQITLASLSGIAQSEISRIERLGITPRNESKRSKLAKALEVSVGRLFPDDVGAPAGDPLPPKRVLLRSSRFDDYVPAAKKRPRDPFNDEPAKPEPVAMTRTVCRWCGMQYRAENEVKIMVGPNVIKTYGHLPCLEQDVRTDGLELKKRHTPR
jgi:transcriptional regulator with XRE-family HTH domain